MVEYIQVNLDNINNEHICCCISNKKCQEGYEDKKEYLKNQFKNGFEFWKLNVRHKVFIQFEPIENTWYGVEGENINFISCFWFAGQYKGQGHGKKLIEIAKEKSKGKNGLATIVGKKKNNYLSDRGIFEKYGFEVVDENGLYILLYCDFKKGGDKPKFSNISRKLEVEGEGVKIYYSPLCPFCRYYTQLLEEQCRKEGIEFEKIYVDTIEKARKLPHPIPIYSGYYKGQFLANEVLTFEKLKKMMEKIDRKSC